MENPEEILHSLEEFAKLKPKDIPRELEEYLCFVAKTGDPVYQWSAVKSLFREKLINVITEFYLSCPSMDIPPCPNVEMFNYDSMKNFILEKLDTFTAAPFTVQRICELLTTPRKEYNRIDKYMRALEKNILVVSTMEPGNRRNAENGEGIVNGIENEHLPEIIAIATATNDMMKDIDYNASWPRINQEDQSFINVDRPTNEQQSSSTTSEINTPQESNRINITSTSTSSEQTETVITCSVSETSTTLTVPSITITESNESNLEKPIENVEEVTDDETQSVPAQVQKRRNSIEPITTDDNAVSDPVEKIESLESVVSSSETESSNSSCSNDTIQTDVSDKSEFEENSQENQKINVENEETEITSTETQIKTEIKNNDEDKIDVEDSKEDIIEDDTKVEYVTITVSPPDEPIKPMVIESEKDLPKESLKTQEENQNEPKSALQMEETPMEVDVENSESSDQNVQEETTSTSVQ